MNPKITLGPLHFFVTVHDPLAAKIVIRYAISAILSVISTSVASKHEACKCTLHTRILLDACIICSSIFQKSLIQQSPANVNMMDQFVLCCLTIELSDKRFT